jgi:outer membrane protein assembly factor BamB
MVLVILFQPSSCVCDSVVYAADRKGTVKAVNADDGKEVWSVNLAEKDGWFSRKPALLSGGLTVAGGHVYVGSEKAQVYALNTSDGSIAGKPPWPVNPVSSGGERWPGADSYQQRPAAGAERSGRSGEMDR